jgi:hypothetical protein
METRVVADEASDVLGIASQDALIDDNFASICHKVSCLLRQETWNTARIGNTPNKPQLPAKPVTPSSASPGHLKLK